MNFEVQATRPAVFLDRDGTINAEVNYLSDPDQLQLLPTVTETIAMLNLRKIPVVVVTNQAGIARGYFSEIRLVEIHERLQSLLAEHHAKLDGLYYCPHHATEGLGHYLVECDCRKPLPGMLKKAARDLRIDLSRSLMVGDRESDLQAGASAGCQTALVRTGYGLKTSKTIDLDQMRGIGMFDDLKAAVDLWLTQNAAVQGR